jgi:hypothetical protein
MFLLYHSEGCNICEMEFYKCYVNDLCTTTCSGMLGHRSFDFDSARHLALVVYRRRSSECNKFLSLLYLFSC